MLSYQELLADTKTKDDKKEVDGLTCLNIRKQNNFDF